MNSARIRFLLEVESAGMVYRTACETFVDEMVEYGFLYGGPTRFYLTNLGRWYIQRLTEVPIDS